MCLLHPRSAIAAVAKPLYLWYFGATSLLRSVYNMAVAKRSTTKYEPMPRYGHTSAQVGLKVMVHGGKTKNDSVQNKKRLASIVDVFNPHTEEWETKYSTGRSPVQGMCWAASTSVKDGWFVYGGVDGDDKYWNSLHQLRTKTYHWVKLSPQCAKDESPMAKRGAAMTVYGGDLGLFGGYGLPHGPAKHGSSFIKDTSCTDGRGWTNEFHMYHPKERRHACAVIIRICIMSCLGTCPCMYMYTCKLHSLDFTTTYNYTLNV